MKKLLVILPLLAILPPTAQAGFNECAKCFDSAKKSKGGEEVSREFSALFSDVAKLKIRQRMGDGQAAKELAGTTPKFKSTSDRLAEAERAAFASCSEVCPKDEVGLSRAEDSEVRGLEPRLDTAHSQRDFLHKDLKRLASAEKRFFAQFGFYTTDLYVLLGDADHTVSRYEFGFVADGSVPAGKLPKDLRLDSSLRNLRALLKKANSSNQVHPSVEQFSKAANCPSCTVTPNGFKAVGYANLDKDGDLDIWTVDQDGRLEQLSDDLK